MGTRRQWHAHALCTHQQNPCRRPLTHLSVQPGSGSEIHVTFAGSEAAQQGFALGQNIALSPKQIYIFSQNQLIDYAI